MAFAPALGLAGGLLSAGGTLISGYGQSQALQYQSQVAANNAVIAQQKAAYDIQAGQVATGIEALKNRAQAGTLLAAQGASGVDVNGLSSAAVRATNREMGYVDTQQIMANAKLQQYADLAQATQYQAQSKLYSYEAPFALIGGGLGAAGQATGAFAKWYTPTAST